MKRWKKFFLLLIFLSMMIWCYIKSHTFFSLLFGIIFVAGAWGSYDEYLTMRDGKIKTLMRKDRGRNYTTIGCGIFALAFFILTLVRLVSNPKEILLGENGPFGILLLFIFILSISLNFL